MCHTIATSLVNLNLTIESLFQYESIVFEGVVAKSKTEMTSCDVQDWSFLYTGEEQIHN